MDCTTTRDCVERLKQHGTSLGSCEVVDSSGTVVPVAVPKIRTRWARLARTLDELEWRRVRALDARGAMLEQIVRLVADDDDEPDPEQDEPQLPDELDVTYRFAERTAQLCMQAQREALKPYVQHQQLMIDGLAKLVGVLSDRLVQLERMFGRSLKMAHDAATAGGEGEEDSSASILAMLGQVAFAQQFKQAAAAAGAAPPNGAPPNGANGKGGAK